jgi:4-amino-4-deoxy-L-arabinose transferase-like glycosyltransferase
MSERRQRLAEAIAVFLLLSAGFALRARIGSGVFVYAGSDSYGYNKLADELRRGGRYALGPPPEPLHYARPPLYPLYVAVIKRDGRAEMSGGEGWQRIKRANVWLEVVGTGLLLYYLTRRLAGRGAALLALALLMLLPFNALATPAALTETLATFLAVALLAVLVHLAHGDDPPRRRWFAVAGGLLALGVLTRPDGLLLAPAFLPAVWRAGDWRARARVAALALLGFALVFAPWPARNLLRFGRPHLLGGRIDRFSRPVEHYQGSWAYLRSFARDWRPMTALTTCLYLKGCTPGLGELMVHRAFDSDAERDEVARLLALRGAGDHTPEVSAGFQALADAKRRAHPLRTELGLPLLRFYAMWVAHHDEFLPPHAPVASWRRALLPLSAVVFFATLIGAALVCLARRTRLAGLTLVLAVYGRTLILAWTFYCMPRYLLESLPLAYALFAGGVAVAFSALRRESARRKAMSGVESASTKI